MKVGIYGGTFNPPHLGHTNAAAAACTVLGLDKLLFVPASLPPHKQLSEDAASAACRLEMLSIAVDGLRFGSWQRFLLWSWSVPARAIRWIPFPRFMKNIRRQSFTC